MINIPVVTKNKELISIIKEACKPLSNELQPLFMSNHDEVVEFLKYELPEIKIFDCGSDANQLEESMAILSTIKQDPWLHYGGVIAIHREVNDKIVNDQLKHSNVLAVMQLSEFKKHIGRLLRILVRNKQFLFQRGMQRNLLNKVAGTFIMDNDPLDIAVYTNLVSNFLYNANLISLDDKEKLHVALQELLINAIEHGNCKIGYSEKTAWLEAGKHPMDLIRSKNSDPAIAKRKVKLEYDIGRESSRFTIEDEGEGFDWRAQMAKAPEIGLHGLGMRMAGSYVQKLAYNEKGNRVSFLQIHQINASNMVPQIFSNQEELVFKPKQVIVKEGEQSDYLYYIVSGRYLVYSEKKYVSFLTPDDMFIGEMSFLLSNRRTASVVSHGEGRAIKISKQAFVELIKKNPHYGIFLARLLAQRLTRINAHTAKLNTEYLRLKAIADNSISEIPST
jgi:anti-sigma regulatory factor (Ser/Thr protein kinase)